MKCVPCDISFSSGCLQTRVEHLRVCHCISRDDLGTHTHQKGKGYIKCVNSCMEVPSTMSKIGRGDKMQNQTPTEMRGLGMIR